MTNWGYHFAAFFENREAEEERSLRSNEEVGHEVSFPSCNGAYWEMCILPIIIKYIRYPILVLQYLFYAC